MYVCLYWNVQRAHKSSIIVVAAAAAAAAIAITTLTTTPPLSSHSLLTMSQWGMREEKNEKSEKKTEKVSKTFHGELKIKKRYESVQWNANKTKHTTNEVQKYDDEVEKLKLKSQMEEKLSKKERERNKKKKKKLEKKKKGKIAKSFVCSISFFFHFVVFCFHSEKTFAFLLCFSTFFFLFLPFAFVCQSIVLLILTWHFSHYVCTWRVYLALCYIFFWVLLILLNAATAASMFIIFPYFTTSTKQNKN